MAKKLVALILFILFLSGAVSAAGVALGHWPGNPKKVNAGNKGGIEMSLQNMGGEGDVFFDLSLDNDAGIARLSKKTYFVSSGSEVPAVLWFEIPIDAEAGREYSVIVSFRVRSANQAGGIQTSMAITKTIPFLVVGEEVKHSPIYFKTGTDYGFLFFVFLGIVFLVFIAAFVFLRFRQKKRAF